MAPGTSAQASSNLVARRRDALLLWFLLRHPSTAGMLAGIGLFPSRKKATRRLRKLERRRVVRCLGSVALKDGRPEHVFGRGRWKSDNLLHEVQLTRVCLKMHADELRRGAGEVDPLLRPDAELRINGERYFLEMDLGSMSYPDVIRKRFAGYRGCRDLVLWISPTVSRMEGLRRHAGMLRDIALFTTLDQALADPHGAIWVDVNGERAALPRTRRGGDIGGDQGGAKDGDKRGTLSPPGCGAPTPSPGNEAPTATPAPGSQRRCATLTGDDGAAPHAEKTRTADAGSVRERESGEK
jgi:hypothetical protein